MSDKLSLAEAHVLTVQKLKDNILKSLFKPNENIPSQWKVEALALALQVFVSERNTTELKDFAGGSI